MKTNFGLNQKEKPETQKRKWVYQITKTHRFFMKIRRVLQNDRNDPNTVDYLTAKNFSYAQVFKFNRFVCLFNLGFMRNRFS